MSFSPGEIITIPSPIDVHAHLREPGGEEKETIESGTYAALAGGYQAIFDMPNNPGGNETRNEARLDEKYEIAKNTAQIDFGAYAGVDFENPAFEEFPALVSKAAGIKFYMGPTTGNTKVYNLDTARPTIDRWVDEARKIGEQPPILLHARGDIGYETADYIAGEKGYPVHWCHIASATEVGHARYLTKMFPELYTGGVTPHHLTMTSRNADFQQGWNGARMQPPLGEEVDADALLQGYNEGIIQILETDHAPQVPWEKMNAEAQNPQGETEEGCVTCYGISGIEFVLPVMMSLVQRDIVDIDRLVDSLYTQPARMLGLKAVGGAMTTLEINPYVIQPEDIIGKSQNTPYIGWTAWAQVQARARYQARILRYGSAI